MLAAMPAPTTPGPATAGAATGTGPLSLIVWTPPPDRSRYAGMPRDQKWKAFNEDVAKIQQPAMDVLKGLQESKLVTDVLPIPIGNMIAVGTTRQNEQAVRDALSGYRITGDMELTLLR